MTQGTPGDLMAQVRSYLTNAYSQTASGVAATSKQVLAFEPIGMPISPEDFRSNENDPNSPMLASIGVQRTAQYSDWVPILDANDTLQIGTRTVVGQYTIALEESQPAEPSNLDAFAAVKAPARKLFDGGQLVGLDTSGAGADVQYYPVFPTPPDWYDVTNQANWTHATVGQQADTDAQSGQGTLHGTWMFSFDTGAEVGSGSSDVWWEQMTNVDRQLVPKAPALLVNLGNANFDAINLATLQGYQYGSTPIPGSANATNQLTPGDVFAVRTSGGNYAKVQVITYDYNLVLRWTTYKKQSSGGPPPVVQWRMLPETINVDAHPADNFRVQARAMTVTAAPSLATSTPTAVTVTRPGAATEPAPADPPVALARRDFVAPVGGWRNLVQVVQNATPQPTQSDGLSMSFDYCIVRLDRPWLSMDFLGSPGWYVTGVPAAGLSNGSDLSGTYPFCAIPTALVAIKSLTVSANWSGGDKTAAQSAVAVGVFSLAGSQFDGQTLSCPGIQIVAWVCTPTPLLPPNSPPTQAVNP
jgi:hypothetical protein